MFETMDHAVAQKALDEIAKAMLAVAPPEWQSLRLQYSTAGTVARTLGWFSVPSGAEHRMMELPDDAWAFEDLREATYQQGKGAWYIATVLVHVDGRYEVDYDYDTRPDIGFNVHPETFVDDLEDFPRDEALRPQWLTDMVAASGGG